MTDLELTPAHLTLLRHVEAGRVRLYDNQHPDVQEYGVYVDFGTGEEDDPPSLDVTDLFGEMCDFTDEENGLVTEGELDPRWPWTWRPGLTDKGREALSRTEGTR